MAISPASGSPSQNGKEKENENMDWSPSSGAANCSASGLKRQDNDLIVIESVEAAAAFKHNFEVRYASGETRKTFANGEGVRLWSGQCPIIEKMAAPI
jgi:hypothetical protein